MKRIKVLLKDKSLIIAIGVTLSIAYLSLMRMPKDLPNFNNIDKLEHIFSYFTLGICWLFTFYKKPKSKYLILLGCILFGILIEVMQSIFTNYRTGDYLDALANTFGATLGLIVFNLISKKMKLINK
ncbi:MAG: VanZ family protein [Polaribacter sp.]